MPTSPFEHTKGRFRNGAQVREGTPIAWRCRMPTTQTNSRTRMNRTNRNGKSRMKLDSRSDRARTRPLARMARMERTGKIDITKTNGQYGIDDLTYDLVTILHNKSKGLEAYRRYIADARVNGEIRAMLERFRNDDREKVQELRACLVDVLGHDSHG